MLDELFDQSVKNFGAIIVPAQHWPSAKVRKLAEGECRLLLAILEDAVHCYLTNVNPRTMQQRAAFTDVRDWFYAPRDARRQAPISFEAICDLFEIDAEEFRRRLNSISIRDLPKNRKAVCRAAVVGRRRGPDEQTRKHQGG